MRSILCLLFSCLSISVFSQSWRPGKVTTKDGTTLVGQIRDLEWEYAPKEIEFKGDDELVRKIPAEEILSFSTNRPAFYESHTVQYDGDSQQAKHLSESKEIEHMITDRLLLEVKVNAPIGLLYTKEKNGHKHYFIKQDSTVMELLNRSYLNPDDKVSIINLEMYKQQLTIITNDCHDIQQNLKSLRYNDDQLTSVFTKINQCKNNAITPPWDGPVSARKRASAGIAVQGFFSETFYVNYFSSKYTSPNFGAGIFLELYNKKRPNRVSFYNELLYKQVSSLQGNLLNGREVDLECTKIKLINAIRLSYPNKAGGRFYAGIGVDNGVRLNTLIDDKTSGYLSEGDYESGFELGIIGMVGETFVLFKSFKVNTEVRYEYEFDLSKTFSFHNIGLSLQFNLK